MRNRGVLYIPGFLSGQESEETIALREYFEKNNHHNFVCYDPHGIGKSDRHFVDCDMNTWIKNAQEMIEMMHEMTNQPPLIIGKSMGGHIAAHVAQTMSEVHALLLICPAINYGHVFHQLVLSYLSNSQINDLENGNHVLVDLGNFEGWEPFPYSLKLYKSFVENFVAKSDCIKGNFPIHLVHGINDISVPYSHITSINFHEMFESQKYQVTLIKNCDHLVLSNKYGFQVVKQELQSLMAL